MEPIDQAFARALSPAFASDPNRADELAAALAAEVHPPDSPEASLRVEPDGNVRGGRMMLERASVRTARRIAAGLGVRWTTASDALVSACDALGVHLICGWDVGGERPMYKLYANASDASEPTRRALGRRLNLPPNLRAPQVVGLNVDEASTVTKAYYQLSTAAALPDVDVPAPFLRIEAAAWVAAYAVSGATSQLRALFAATLSGGEPSAERALAELTPVTWKDLAERFPFEPGPLRQMGWTPSGTITVYAKRQGRAKPVHALAPTAVFRAADAEVGLYLEPSADAPSAFTRTKRHALSFRMRQGTPPPEHLEPLGAWALSCVARAEAEDAAPAFDEPPAPWRKITA